jgi:hypothetical protein
LARIGTGEEEGPLSDMKRREFITLVGAAPASAEPRAQAHPARVPSNGPSHTLPTPKVFRSGREFAAWLGLVPRQNSTGGKTRLGGITKRGNRYLRRLLINGASANLLRSKATKADPWVIGLRHTCSGDKAEDPWPRYGFGGMER